MTDIIDLVAVAAMPAERTSKDPADIAAALRAMLDDQKKVINTAFACSPRRQRCHEEAQGIIAMTDIKFAVSLRLRGRRP